MCAWGDVYVFADMYMNIKRIEICIYICTCLCMYMYKYIVYICPCIWKTYRFLVFCLKDVRWHHWKTSEFSLICLKDVPTNEKRKINRFLILLRCDVFQTNQREFGRLSVGPSYVFHAKLKESARLSYIWTYIHIYIHPQYLYVYTCTLTYTDKHTCICIYIQIYIYIHTYV